MPQSQMVKTESPWDCCLEPTQGFPAFWSQVTAGLGTNSVPYKAKWKLCGLG